MLLPWRSNSMSFLDDVFTDILGELETNSAINKTRDHTTDIHLEYGFPGVKRKDIAISTNGNKLTIKVDSDREKFEKIIATDIHNLDKVDAKYEDGLLTIDIPLREKPKEKHKLVEIREGP